MNRNSVWNIALAREKPRLLRNISSQRLSVSDYSPNETFWGRSAWGKDRADRSPAPDVKPEHQWYHPQEKDICGGHPQHAHGGSALTGPRQNFWKTMATPCNTPRAAFQLLRAVSKTCRKPGPTVYCCCSAPVVLRSREKDWGKESKLEILRQIKKTFGQVSGNLWRKE